MNSLRNAVTLAVATFVLAGLVTSAGAVDEPDELREETA